MDSILPLHPRIEDPNAPMEESNPDDAPPQPIREEANGSSHSSSDCMPTTLDTSQALPRQPYSPTKPELDAHPIRQRLSIQGDEIVTALGTAPAIPFDFVPHASPAAEELAQNVDRESFGIMADTTIKEGDAVSYSWGGDKKGGTVTEVAKTGSVEMETARGNTATKEAGHNDPALRLNRAGHDVVKNASEVHKEKAGETHNEGGVHKTVGENKNGEAHTGEKRGAEHVEAPKANGEEPKKKKGRPAKNGTTGPKKEVKKRAPKKAATESGEPRRSGRVAGKSS